MNPLLMALLGPLTTILERVIPDPVERAKVQLEMQKSTEEAEARIQEYMTRQIEAQSSLAVSETEQGKLWTLWRPAMSWLVISAAALKLLVSPLLQAGFGVTLEVDDEMLQTFATWWLSIYCVGHTVKFAAEKGVEAVKARN